MHRHWCSHFSYFKKTLHKSYLIINLSMQISCLKKIKENFGFGLQEFGLCYILLDLDGKSFGQQFIIAIITYFTGIGFENTWTTNLDYNYYSLQDLDFKILTLQIWLLIVIYLTGFGLESTWTMNLDYNFTGFRLLNLGL